MKLILSIVFFITSIALFFSIIDPLYSDVKQLRGDVNTYNIALNNSTELQMARDSLIEIYKNIKKEDKDRLEHLLPSTINNIELILEIEKIANSYGLPIKDIKFDSMNPKNKTEQMGSDDSNIVVADSDPSSYLPYGVFPLEFTVEGKYDTFLNFLKDLERNLRLVDIKSISFTVPPPSIIGTISVDPNIYSYTLKIETYWLK